MSIEAVENTIDALKSDRLPLDEVCRLVRHDAAVVRANALEALVRFRTTDEDEVIRVLQQAAIDRTNDVRLIGTVSVAHLAVACLLRVGTEKAVQAAGELIDEWPEPDRNDLLWYLESEGLPVREEAKPTPG